MRIVFMGTPEFSVPTLSEIIGVGHEVVAVYTQPPRPAGRGLGERKSPVQVFAEAAGIEVVCPKNLRGQAEQHQFATYDADVAVVVAYGLILPRAVLDAPRHGCLNLHGSALPRWRGAAPIQRAIMAGDTETAAMVMQMDEGLDTGAICLGEQIGIGPDMTAGELHDTMSVRGAGLMVRALAALERDSLVAVPQSDEGMTYAAKIDKAEAKIDFNRDARALHNLIRGLSPYPGAWFEASIKGRRERIKVLRSEFVPASQIAAENHAGSSRPGSVLDDALTIACQTGAVRLTSVQRAGKRPVSAREFLNGAQVKAGDQLAPV